MNLMVMDFRRTVSKCLGNIQEWNVNTNEAKESELSTQRLFFKCGHIIVNLWVIISLYHLLLISRAVLNDGKCFLCSWGLRGQRSTLFTRLSVNVLGQLTETLTLCVRKRSVSSSFPFQPYFIITVKKIMGLIFKQLLNTPSFSFDVKNKNMITFLTNPPGDRFSDLTDFISAPPDTCWFLVFCCEAQKSWRIWANLLTCEWNHCVQEVQELRRKSVY